jgi:hypothetical protein
MSKNMFLVVETPNQPALTVGDLTVNNSLTLTGTHEGSLLQINSSSMVTELLKGPDNYVLTIDPGTHDPAWSNVVILDQLTTNALNINGTSNGDLLQIGTTNNVERVPIGSSGQVLTVNNAANGVEWLNPSSYSPAYCSGNLTATIPYASTGPGDKTFGNTYQTLYSNLWNASNLSNLTYTGSVTKTFCINASISVSTQQDSTSYFFYSRLNGNEINGGRCYAQVNKQYANMAINCMVSVSPLQNIDFALNLITPSSGADINVFEMDFTITQVN